ncbi:hypothetical protein BGZ46_001808 [Entomortierella lignicola]|nr:hypothetical protein BGZ46_001808 [Entomortierella lignicola]
MHDFMEAHYRNSSRKDDYEVPPFYYPGLSPSGPNVVFVLRINSELYPVFVQTKLLKGIYPGDVEDARLTVHESRIKDHLPNLSTYCPSGKYLSLLYVHPTIKKTPRMGWDDDSLWDSEPETGANDSHSSMDADKPLMQLLMIIDGSNMRNFVLRGVVDLLDSVKGTKKVVIAFNCSAYIVDREEFHGRPISKASTASASTSANKNSNSRYASGRREDNESRSGSDGEEEEEDDDDEEEEDDGEEDDDGEKDDEDRYQSESEKEDEGEKTKKGNTKAEREEREIPIRRHFAIGRDRGLGE